VVKVHGLQVTELAEVREEEIAPFRDSFPDGSVKRDDPQVFGFLFGRKLL
jgi:hypothetical protein